VNTLRSIWSLIASKALTVWLVGLFLLYYLTMAVWSEEAFGTYINHLSSSNLFRAFYLLFLLNITVRIVRAGYALRHRRMALVLRLPLAAGLVLLLASVFGSLNTRSLLWSQPVGEGDPLLIPWEKTSYRIRSVVPAVKKRSLRTGASAIFDYEPGATIVDDGGRERSIGAFPPSRVGTTYLHVLLFGIGPGFEVRRGKELLSRGFVALRLTPFGVVDQFEIEGLPYQFFVSIIPNRVVKRGRESANEYDLERTRYRVEAVRGDAVVARGETEGDFPLEGGIALRFLPPADWIIVQAVHDPFLLWIAVGLVFMVCGFPLYPWSWLALRGPGSAALKDRSGT
jgi:hypothetical protein